MRKLAILCLVVFLASAAAAQTKMSGSLTCAPSDPAHIIRVGDDPGHAYGVAQGSCTWTRPWEIAGEKATVGIGTQVQHIKGNTMKARGTFVDTMTNGDKVSYSFEFTTVNSASGARVEGHKWEIAGGSGKFRGIKGSGTCTATPQGTDGTFNYECVGQYSLPRS